MDLFRDGCTVIPGVLDPAMVERIRRHAQALVASAPADHRARQRSTGSLIHIAADPVFADLIAWPAALAALDALGLGGARFSSGYVISKPPMGPPLFWHQDWWGWSDPVSYAAPPMQVFLMYYLSDTTPENGCLRIVPGSHRRRHALHDILPNAHGEDLARVSDPSHPGFQPVEAGVDVPVAAGDLVVGDARLLHGAHANRSDAERTLITLWYHPHFEEQPAAMRARVAAVVRREGVDTDPDAVPGRPFCAAWPEAARRKVEPLLATYDGPAEALAWSRVPDAARLVDLPGPSAMPPR
jgi:ectoine hydroxylase-related dioxygenase (phytanoyl-CoA dioxygenase family)